MSQPFPTMEQMVIKLKSLALLVKEKEKIIKEMDDKSKEKDKEIERLKATIKSMEKKNEEILKSYTQIGTSDVKDIKLQCDNERKILNEMIKTMNADNLKKNEIISKLNEELEHSRSVIELERKKNLEYFNINGTNDKGDITIHKISMENTSLKSSLLSYEEKVKSLTEENNTLLNDKKELQGQIDSTLSMKNNVIKSIKESYDNLIGDFVKMTSLYNESKKQISELSNDNINLKNDIKDVQSSNINLEKQVIDLTSELEGIKKRNASYSYEVSSLKKELKNLEKIISDYKLAKQIFNVTYNYMSLTLNGNIIIEKEGDSFSFIIENRTATRKFSFLDVEITIDSGDPTKLILKFIKGGEIEEYYTKEAKRLLETFNDFKRKVIEMTDETSDVKSIKESQEKVVKTEKQLNSFFGMI